MRLHSKSLSKLSLTNLLRRKRSDLKRFLTESGITTYETLKVRCSSLGVLVPSQDEFKDALGVTDVPNVSSPTEGVVVLNPTVVSDESSSSTENVDPPVNAKFKRKKKETIFADDLQEKDSVVSEDD